MTTASWSTGLNHTSDAGFRAWGAELAAKFAAVGMVQTADTGQINWTTVTRPSTNTAAGYEIWRLSGSALYFKIEYGTGSSANNPSFWFTAGTGSNGSGTLTGQQSTQTQCGGYDAGGIVATTNYQSYLCATADYFGLAWKVGSTGTVGRPRSLFLVMRTVDATGAASTVGYFVWLQTTSQACIQQCVATTAGVTGGITQSQAGLSCCLIPTTSASNPPSSQDGAGNNQAFLWWYAVYGSTPIMPLLHAALILMRDLTFGNTASMTLVGTTPHTYLCVMGAGGSWVADAFFAVSQSNLGIIMLWE